MLILLLACVYFALALLHVYWAMGGQVGFAGALPAVDGRFVFQPGRAVTLGVAFMLAGAGALICAWIGVLHTPVPRIALRLGVAALGMAMLARAIGDFRYVGLFRAARTSLFARMDRWLYTPFCIVAGVLLIFSAVVGQ
jgi:hypothetical protein